MPSWYDPFQEIRTMPKGWDLSSLLVTPAEELPPDGGDQADQANTAFIDPNRS
jgi:hypothetical protein